MPGAAERERLESLRLTAGATCAGQSPTQRTVFAMTASIECTWSAFGGLSAERDFVSAPWSRPRWHLHRTARPRSVNDLRLDSNPWDLYIPLVLATGFRG